MERIFMSVDDGMEAAYPSSMGSTVSIELSDGRTFRDDVQDAHGTAAAPCSDAELRDKFRRLAGLAIGTDAADDALDALDRLTESTTRSLSRALQVPQMFVRSVM
jgi:2-methylcitrate dehydratase PrpD